MRQTLKAKSGPTAFTWTTNLSRYHGRPFQPAMEIAQHRKKHFDDGLLIRPTAKKLPIRFRPRSILAPMRFLSGQCWPREN